jgi:signal peptidase I
MKDFIKDFLNFFWEITKVVILALLIVLPIRYFLFQPFIVKGQSMEPNFHTGDYLIVDEISYRFSDPKRGDVIVFKYPLQPNQRYIKRVIGLPGEKVEIKNGLVFINGNPLDESSYLSQKLFTDEKGFHEIILEKDQYFVLGDNRISSSDSRVWGVVPRDKIIGKVFVRIWPFTAMAKIENPSY